MKLPKRIIISLYMLFFLTGLLTCFRLIFATVFYEETINLTSEFIIKSILLGFRFDLRLSVLIILSLLALQNNKLKKLAEKVGFEPTIRLLVYTLSKRAPEPWAY